MSQRTLRALIVPCALLLALASTTSAGARGTTVQPLSFERSQTNPQSPVEQQTPGWFGVDCPPGPGACQPDQSLWVVNPTSCPWDIDDFLSDATTIGAYLDPGATASVGECLIADNAHHIVGVRMSAGGPGLSVTLSYEPFAVAVPVPVLTATSKQVVYGACVIGPLGMSGLPPVEGSNGGVGIPTTVRLTVTNNSGRRVKNIVGDLRLWSATTTRVNDYCPSPPVDATAAGAHWKISA
jgi:hypothetical protein